MLQQLRNPFLRLLGFRRLDWKLLFVGEMLT